jgi:hypothetical protein
MVGERVLFIGTQFSNLYTAVDTSARGRVVRQMSCRQQLAPPQRDAGKMSPRISIGPEPVLADHAPSQPAAGSHCQVREDFSSPLLNIILQSRGCWFSGPQVGGN